MLDGISAREGAESGGASRHPDCWAAYGRFLYTSVRTRSANLITPLADGLLCFRRRFWNIGSAAIYAYQRCENLETDIWTTATKALETISKLRGVDHVHLYVAGAVPPEDIAGTTLHTVLDGRFTALAMPIETHDILELGNSLEEFLTTLGHSNRRHLKARYKEALEEGLKFSISGDPAALGAQDRFALALVSRPKPYPRDLVNAFDAIALSQPGFFHASLRSPEGILLSYCSGFLDADSIVIMYQFNHKDYPDLSLTMTLRSFLIHHWAGTNVKRIVFPAGLAGHLAHAATANRIALIFFLRRSPAAIAKALWVSMLNSKSDAALMVRTNGFFRHLLTRKTAPHPAYGGPRDAIANNAALNVKLRDPESG